MVIANAPHKLLDFCEGLCIRVCKIKLAAKILIFMHLLCLCNHIHVSFCLEIYYQVFLIN